MAGLRQRLGNPRRAGEAIKHGVRINFLNKLQDVGQELELRAGVFNALRLWRVHDKVCQQVQVTLTMDSVFKSYGGSISLKSAGAQA